MDVRRRRGARAGATFAESSGVRALLIATLLLSCGGERWARPTIAQGVYGFGAVELDISDARGLVKSTRARGFFEVALDAGDYRVCVSAERCDALHVAPGETVRLDYGASRL